jgi:tetratricopeptide (TPR) repeat protein
MLRKFAFYTKYAKHSKLVLLSVFVILITLISWKSVLALSCVNLVNIAVIKNTDQNSQYYGLGLSSGPPSSLKSTSLELYNPNWGVAPAASQLATPIALLEWLTKIVPDSYAAHRLLGKFYLNTARFDLAADQLKAAANLRDCQPTNTSWDCGLLWLDLGDVHNALGDNQAALRYYALGHNYGRKEAVALILSSEVQKMLASGDITQARLTFQRISPDLVANSLALSVLSTNLEGLDLPTTNWKSIKYFPLTMLSVSSDPRFELANADAAVQLLKIGVWDMPQLERVVAYRVWRYSDQPALAKFLERLTTQLPTNARLRYYLGEFYQRTDLLDQSLQNYQLAAQTDTNFPSTFFRLGVVNQMLALRSPAASRTTYLQAAATNLELFLAKEPQDILGIKELITIDNLLGASQLANSWQVKLNALQPQLNPVVSSKASPSLVQQQGFQQWYNERATGWSGLIVKADGVHNKAALTVLGADSLDSLSAGSQAHIICLWQNDEQPALPTSEVMLWYWNEQAKNPVTFLMQPKNTAIVNLLTKVTEPHSLNVYATGATAKVEVESGTGPTANSWNYISSSIQVQTQPTSVSIALVFTGPGEFWIDTMQLEVFA